MSDNEIKRLARELEKLSPEKRKKELKRLAALAQKKKAQQFQNDE